MQELANSAWFLLILIVTLLPPLDAIALPASQADVPPSSELELKPVLDLAHRVVPWMDGKLTLIRIPKERGDDVFDLRTEGGKLVILCPDGHVAKVLRIARFDVLAPLVTSEPAALAALA